METRTYNRIELKKFIDSEAFNRLEDIPVSRHRALSQINNPRAEEQDVLLVAQYDGEKMIGYLGILPDRMYWDGETIRMAWLTSFWIHEAYRGRHIKSILFDKATGLWDHKVLITNLIPWTASIYEKTGIFLPAQDKSGIRGYMRFDLAFILPPKSRWFRRMTLLLKILDVSLNALGDIRFTFFRKQNSGDIVAEQISHIDQGLADFIDAHNEGFLHKRGKTELEWIMQNPWVLEGDGTDCEASRYYFSTYSKKFFYRMIKFTRGDEITGLVLLSIRNGNLNIPYVFSGRECLDAIARELVNTMVDLKLNNLTTFQEGLAGALKKQKKSFIFMKRITRTYFIARKLEFANVQNFQDGDGDCAFY
jgi:hypothetical protein